MNNFDPADYIAGVANRLVMEFADAAAAGTPGLIGGAREDSARTQFKRLLPGFTGVGSGLVLDSFGAVSKQQDIVVYEEQLCPIFSINNSPAATYYPVEGVIAVGEIKSTLDTNTLEDSFSKVASAKSLQRFSKPTESVLKLGQVVSFRKYGNSISFDCTKDEEYNQVEKDTDQIFGFILCGKFALSPDTLLNKTAELYKKFPKSQCPNIILSLNDGFMQPFDCTQNALTSPTNANAVMLCNENVKGFPQLIRKLHHMANNGRTICVLHYNRYFGRMGQDKEMFELSGYQFI